jgi:hypothetical protein
MVYSALEVNMKRIIAFVMVLVCIFALASCSISDIKYDHQIAKSKLQKCGYTIDSYNPDYETGIIGYIHAENSDGEEIYLVYCSNTAIARSTYKYVKKMHAANIAELQMEMKMLDYSIHEDSDIDTNAKGEYYKEYLEAEEDLEKYKQYECGVYSNLVWYGTKKAIEDINT